MLHACAGWSAWSQCWVGVLAACCQRDPCLQQESMDWQNAQGGAHECNAEHRQTPRVLLWSGGRCASLGSASGMPSFLEWLYRYVCSSFWLFCRLLGQFADQTRDVWESAICFWALPLLHQGEVALLRQVAAGDSMWTQLVAPSAMARILFWQEQMHAPKRS